MYLSLAVWNSSNKMSTMATYTNVPAVGTGRERALRACVACVACVRLWQGKASTGGDGGQHGGGELSGGAPGDGRVEARTE